MTEITDDFETFTILLTESNGTTEPDEFSWLLIPALGAGILGTGIYHILTRM